LSEKQFERKTIAKQRRPTRRHRHIMMHEPTTLPLDGMPCLKLLLSVSVDLIGYSTYIVPVAGEAADVGWAPISAWLVWYLYGNGWLAGLGFAEEIVPGLDFIPTCTIAWLLQHRTSLSGVQTAVPVSADGDQIAIPVSR
jgi:hypothetical protein